ncbi:MAG: UDP-N-acetylmuramoyl-L-alanyl-D-glutamate--2,6-diaminopimelate ligase [Desulfobulbaceae bacterium]|nr:UDP-N-acetylmuramoyl-L-alanyl-D-glutamate--2,6-diaminopimelate ligase [Desulfobulbaceae bacterium]
MQLIDLEKILGVAGKGNSRVTGRVTAIVSDSRWVIPGSVFVAVRGTVIDGHDYISQAMEKGCLAVVAEHCPDMVSEAISCFQVRDSHAALGRLAAAWNGHPGHRLKLIGLTGTNGKTTTSWLIEKILQQAGFQTGVIGTVNYRYQNMEGNMVVRPAPLTTPGPEQLQALLREMADAGVSHVLIEVSSHALDQKRLAGIRFDVALFTNLTRDHLDYHQTMDSYFTAKKLLFSNYLKDSGTAVVVVDAEAGNENYGNRLVTELVGRDVSTVGFAEDCTIRCARLRQDINGSSCKLFICGEQQEITSNLTGTHNVLNMLAAAGVANALQVPGRQIRAGLAAVDRVPGRLERVLLSGISPDKLAAVFVDYAHTPDGLENVLATMKSMTSGRLICVVGCGGDRDTGKRPLMGEIAGRFADMAILSSDNPRSEDPMAIIAEIERGIQRTGSKKLSQDALFSLQADQHGYLVESDRRKAIHLACSIARPDDVVVIAGKGHEQYQIIGRDKKFFDDRLEAKNGLAAWTTEHLLAATGGRLVGRNSREVLTDISTDTRTVTAGDVFVALVGESFDGHDFLDTAIKRGAGALIVEREFSGAGERIPVIVVEDTLQALGDLAAYRRRILGEDVKIVAITGSSGKTTVKEMAAAVFEQYYVHPESAPEPVLKTHGNFNNLIGLPLSLLPLSAKHRVAVLEMGMNRSGEIARLTEIADPDIACINNVQAAHLEKLVDINGVAQAKGELFAGLRPDAVRIINYDDPEVVRLASRYQGRTIGYGVTAAGRRYKPLVRVTRITGLGAKGTRFTLHIGDWKKRITQAVPGTHNVHNAAAAAAICTAAGVDAESIVKGLTLHQNVDKRMEFMNLPGGLRVLNDSYNANPSSMAAALKTVVSFGTDCRKVAALGDMLELGENAVSAHREIGRLAAELGYTMLAVTGEFSPEVARGAREGGMTRDQVVILADTMAIADWLYHLLISGRLSEGDWLLVKGSRGMRMENLLVELRNCFDPAPSEA